MMKTTFTSISQDHYRMRRMFSSSIMGGAPASNELAIASPKKN
jgi:hypothetical protein